jgi:hypothetical protein
MPDLEQVPLSDDLLAVMRRAARLAIDGHEPFVTPRAILLALLEDEKVGSALQQVVTKDRIAEAQISGDAGPKRLIEERMERGEEPAMIRYDTLAFKTPDGRSSVWLNRDAYEIFVEGAQRADDRYYPKHLALGVAAHALHAPGILAAIRVEPGTLVDAIYKL